MARKKALNKDIRVEIKKSLGRYISIFLIVALGVSFFSGLRSTESDMRYTGDAFSDASNLMDIRVISTMGLTDDDVEALSQVEGISGAEPSYMKDAITKQNETDYVVELLSMPEKMNQIQVTEGRLPENENECLLDNRLKKAFEVKVGDTISFVSGTDTELSEDLTQTSYTVTGFGDSPLFISMERGSSMIGSGQINGFAIVQKDVFTQDYYTQIYLTAADAYDEIAFTDAYTQAVEPVQKRVEALEEERCQARYDEVTKEPRQELNDARKTWQEEKDNADSELDDARAKLDDGWAQLSDAKDQLAEGRKEYEQNYETTVEQLKQQQAQLDAGKAMMSEDQIAQAQGQIDAAYAALDEAKNTLDQSEAQIKENEEELTKQEETYESSKAEAKQKLDDAWKEIEDGQKELDDIKMPTWQVINRESLPGYTDYGSNAERMGAIGTVFPAIFFLVAALVSLTAMTRMVEEQRTQIGMMKALGYSGVHIAMKYVTYALAATLSGSILGAVIGEKLLPWIIINAYKMMYTGLGAVYTPLEIEYSVMAGGLAVGVVVLAVLSACYKELREKPAQLMRPVAPKEGKRILLERIPFIWKRLSFIWKATMRNLFRYKKRFFMTIFGIGGCMALLLLGFGIKDSISAISEKQYGEIITYDFSITHKDGISETKKEDLIQYAKKQEHMTDLIEVSESAVTIRANGKKQDATMIQPMSKKDLNGYISLQDRKSKTKYQLDDDGIILTEKAASLLGVKKGDSIKIQRSGDKQITAKISQITENYMQHKVYMTPKLYEKLYHKKAQTTGIYCIEKNISKKKMQENGKQILARDEASTLHFCADDEKTMSDMVNNLNIVVVVLIVSAGLLAFVVLYNLNNINISERRMELATIKVLGFYDGEVGAYVYRENILLTILGTIAGIILGIILHKYVIFTTEVDLIMFGRQIYVQSYIYSILLTIAFSILVNAFVYFQLKKIDMVESLKSTE